MLESPFEWGVASRAFPGEKASGDLHLVKALPGGVLLAAVDGRFAGLMAVADPIRASTPEALQLLRDEGLRYNPK